MIEGNRDRRPCRIRARPHFLMTPWISTKPVVGRATKRPISVHTALSELQFVSEEDEDTSSPSDLDSDPSTLSPISQLKFASPEETITVITPIEFAGPPPQDSSFPSPVNNSPSSGAHEEQAQMMPSEQLPPQAHTSPVSPQPGWSIPGLDRPAISSPTEIGRRPLPEPPEHTHSRPLPPRPAEIATVPCWQGSGRFSYPPHQEFVQGPSEVVAAAPRPVSDTGPNVRSQSVGENPQNLDSAPEDDPPTSYPPASPAIVSPPSDEPSTPSLPCSPANFSPPIVASPIVFPTTPKPSYPAPILMDLLSPATIDLVTASSLTITGENGEQILFGTLFRDRKVIVIFIRHFWCPHCQDYARSISGSVTPGILKRKGVDLIIIGNGAPGMIKAYKSASPVVFHYSYNR